MINSATPETEKSKRYNDQSWEQLSDNPAFPILQKYKDTVFRDKLQVEHVVQDKDIQHTIELTDDVPISVKQFRLSPEQQDAVAKWTAEMSAAGLIRPSCSPYSSPIFCVKKPVGWRIVHDYRLLNAKTRIPQEPIPRKDDIMDSMQGSYWFSCMDLLSGYYQRMLKEEHRKFTAFSTPLGHWRGSSFRALWKRQLPSTDLYRRFLENYRTLVGLSLMISMCLPSREIWRTISPLWIGSCLAVRRQDCQSNCPNVFL